MPYLDHAASTPMVPEAVAAMTAVLAGEVGNPSSPHAAGRRARRSVEENREVVAAALGARPGDVVFTSGGTESDNLAVKGLYWGRRAEDPALRAVLTTAVEHHAVLDAAAWLQAEQSALTRFLAVDEVGRLRPEVLDAALAELAGQVALVSAMWANNEVGTVSPVPELAAVCARHGVAFHTDAVQAVGQLPVNFADSGADALSVTGHKLGGPVGTGALLLRRGVACAPLTHGGGQERDVRSGTVDAAGIAGFAAAVQVAAREQPERAARLARLRDDLVAGVLQAVPDARYSGDPDPDGRLPGNAHFTFPGCEGDSLLLLLDARGVECSTGSACSAGVSRPSHVLLAMGASQEQARGSLRFSLGHTSTPADIAAVCREIGPAVERARRAGLLSVARRESA